MNNIQDKDYIPLTPFKGWVLENFPFIEANFDAITNYELICQLTKYLNEVISNQNQVQELGSELVEGYNELLNYVTNYFNNLDVQEEINNKLDSMAEDGTLTALIGGYVQPIQTAFESEVRTTLNTMQGEINSVVSGSPAGVYATTDALSSADPDHSKIYLVTADGKWYYYSSGDSDWVAGGTYQGTTVTDESVTLEKLADDVKFNLNQRINNKDVYNLNNENYINLTDNIINGTINASTGILSSLTDEVYFVTENYYYVPEDAIIPVFLHPSWNVVIYYYDKDFNYISYRNISTSGSVTCMIINVIKNSKYIRFRFNKQDNSTSTVSAVIAEFNNIKLENFNNQLKTHKGTNLFNPYKYIVGYLNNSAANPFQIQQIENTTYRTTYPIPVEGGKSYYIRRFRQFILLDNNLEYVSGTGIYSDTENYTFTPVNDGYIVFSYNQPYADSEIVAQSDTAVSYTPYKEYLPDYIDLSNLIQTTNDNILYNKKYVALGDSFTHGDFANSPTDDYTILSGLYQGSYKVYPYLIGNRNNMDVTNLAENGMTITNVGGVSNNYLSDDILEQIPEDVDYITIKIGINDNPDHQNATLGTITSSDRTTFYGAWNYVINYLITNYPNAKIGIIISNGMTSSDFINAEINIAKRYGVAYINETTDSNVPLLIRTQRTDVLSSIKTLRDQEWEVLPGTNNHPNAKCHEYESTIIEDFLRRL